MGKRDRHFERIEEYKERFRNYPIEKLEERLALGNLFKEAAIAYRELIEEKKAEDVSDNQSEDRVQEDA